jgi:dTDP-4-dehydrorhamnose 3,5-epimerase
MKFNQTTLPNLMEITIDPVCDHRGSLVKFFQRAAFVEYGLPSDFAEQLYTTSRHGVLRGMHFQCPPHGCAKLVQCIAGRVLDVLVDLRVGSPAYGKSAAFELDASHPRALFVPTGLAHGLYVVSDHAIMLYNLTAAYAPAADGGILWSSIDYRWPDPTPIVSPRDRALAPLEDFVSPFSYRPSGMA